MDQILDLIIRKDDPGYTFRNNVIKFDTLQECRTLSNQKDILIVEPDSMKFQSLLRKPEVIYLLIGVAVIIILGVIYFSTKKHNEGFYPLGQERIAAGDMSMRRYNDFSSTQNPMRSQQGVIPSMEPGDVLLNGVLDTPAYEADAGRLRTGAGQAPNFNNERKYRAPPEIPALVERIKMCQKVTSWSCEALSNPEFAKYCGICTKDGEDYIGQPHIGGLYLAPDEREDSAAQAAKSGTTPVYKPTFGVCKGEFIVDRPYCDVQKDRDDCKNSTSLNKSETAAKCGYCVSSGGFVYVGSRGDETTNYALSGNPTYHNARLRIGVSHPNEATVTITRVSDGSVMPGNFITGTNVYMANISDTFENEQFKISVKYPQWNDYQFTADELTRIKGITVPKSAPLVRAAYGANIDDYTKDAPGAKDVTDYIKNKFNIGDCSRTAVSVSNDGLGGDPVPGTYKQVRLAYSNDGANFAYAYGREGGITKPILDSNFRNICAPPISLNDATKAVCEQLDGEPTGRVFTTDISTYYGAKGKTKCVAPLEAKPRGIVGIWESAENTPRTVPLDLSVIELNGLATNADGIPKYGTVQGSKQFKAIAPATSLPNIPPYLFWLWGRKSTATNFEILTEMPALLRNPTVPADIALCPSGPISTTPQGSARLQAGVCEKFVNGRPQGPGTYTDDCIRSLYLEGGCPVQGKAFPNSSAKLKDLRTNPVTGEFNTADEIIDQVTTNLFNPASTGLDANGQLLDIDMYAKVTMDCFGRKVSNVCDTPFKDTGPLTPACLDYLFKNAGRDNPTIGPTYSNMDKRSSGTDRTSWTPIMYCQRTGSISPIDAKGKLNLNAIQTANSKGGVEAVRAFYRQIHYDANFNMNRNAQKENLQKCYGLDIGDAAKPCEPGKPAAPARIPPRPKMGKLDKPYNGFTYQGCYADKGSRPLPNRLNDINRVEECYEQARARGYKTFGTQYYHECWAGNNDDWNRDGKLDNDGCGDLGTAYNNQVYTINK